MIDWIAFLDTFLHWVQIFTSLSILGLALIALLTLCINKRIAFNCGLSAAALFIVALVLRQFGIWIISPEVFAFFGNFFK